MKFNEKDGMNMGIEKIYYWFAGVDTDVVYLIDPDDIKVPGYYFKTPIGKKKYERKRRYYLENGEFESMVILKRDDWSLVDGFSTYKLAKVYGQKCPCMFVD